MIPKIIHYFWFGRNPLPEIVVKCIESWKKFLPDYEIKLWNEDNFDVNIIPYTREAYKAKKYAFVSDYARFYILEKYGGVYFDTDVELIKPIDDLIERGSLMATETHGYILGGYPSVAPGLVLVSYKNNPLYKEILEIYSHLSFINSDGTLNLKTVVITTTELLIKKGLKRDLSNIQYLQNVIIYPGEYFGPRSVISKRMHITSNTRAIHHYAGSWVNSSIKNKFVSKIRSFLPETWLIWWNKRHKKICN